MPPFAELPLSKVPEPTAEFPPLELVVVAVVVPDDDFFDPHPATSTANAQTAAMVTVSRASFCLLIRSSSFRFGGSRNSSLGSNVERIAEAVAQEVERERGDDQEGTREEHQPPRHV